MDLPSGSTTTTLATIAAGATVFTKLAKPFAESGAKLIETMLGEPCKVAGGMLSDQLYAWQLMNRVKIAAKAKEKLDAAGIEPKAVSPGFLMPFLEAAGNVEEECLQDLWANLLASGTTSDVSQHPLFLSALRNLTKHEVEALILLAKDNEFKVPDLQTLTPGREEDARPMHFHVIFDFLTSIGLTQKVVTEDRGYLFLPTVFGVLFMSAVGVTKDDNPQQPSVESGDSFPSSTPATRSTR